MNKILLIDIGNTRLKWALLKNEKMIEKNIFSWQENKLEATLGEHWEQLEKPEAIYVSNVAGDVIRTIISQWCLAKWQITPIFATVSDFCCGVTNSYSDPEKLGVDRWLAMIAAWSPRKKNVCIFDCGSAVTMDVVSSDGTHQGGMIAPGLSLSARALTDHTHALSAEESASFPMLANNTEDAINSGCYHQFIGGIQYMINKTQQQFGSGMEYIITGGDAEIALAALDLGMSHEPELILQGLLLISHAEI